MRRAIPPNGERMTSPLSRLLLAGAFLALAALPARAQVATVTDGSNLSNACRPFVVAARGASLSSASASNTVTGKPRCASASAVTKPTGPPPAINTRSFIS